MKGLYTGRVPLCGVGICHTHLKQIKLARSLPMLPLDRYNQHKHMVKTFCGKRYVGWNGKVYLCESYDFQGFWMQNVADPTDRRNVSVRALGSTFHVERGNAK